MCITNIYIDRYPDGKELTFQETQYCQYGSAGRPCQKHSTLSNPVRKIQFGELTTEFIMTHKQPSPSFHQQPHHINFPSTPPRSRGGSQPRDKETSPRPIPALRRSKRHSVMVLPVREHRKERIVIVDSPPTPRTPPMQFSRPQVFTAPSSPATPPYHHVDRSDRGRPIIVDERGGSLRRDQSVTVNVGERITERLTERATERRPRRSRSQDRGIFQWDSPSSSHTSFDSRARREAEEVRAREEDERRERDLAALEATKRLEARIKLQDEEIRRRPAVPIPPSPLRRRESARSPVIEQALPQPQPQPRRDPRANSPRDVPVMGKMPMTAGELAIAEEAEIRRRMAERDREAKADRERAERELKERELKERVERALEERVGREKEREKREEAEAMVKRLRERQMPKRRFSVGPGGRRHRIMYDDGAYRWE